MPEETQIQWCDSTVNPIMGCSGCELFPNRTEVIATIDQALISAGVPKTRAKSKSLFQPLIDKAYVKIKKKDRSPHHLKAVTTTNIWHFRKDFEELVRDRHGSEAAAAAEAAIQRSVTCYAAKLHLNKGYSLKPKDDGTSRKPHPGHAPTFEEITRYDGRVAEVANYRDLLGAVDPDRLWINRLPRLIFVSDMGDALSRKMDLPWLKHEVIEPIETPEGQRHLWLWLTKRPDRMAELADEIGGLPDNVCAMTTVTGPDGLERINQLRKVKAKVRGLSMEPLWEEVPARQLNLKGIDWVIAGGESGNSKFVRSFPVEWAKRLRDHCRKQGVAFFLKQFGRRPTKGGKTLALVDSHGGDWDEWESSLRVREFPEYFHGYRADEMPTTAGLRRPPKGKLTTSEREDFKRLEKVVERAVKTFVEAAAALYEIRDRKLYRGKFKRFEDYCQSVHKISRQYANKLIKAGKIRIEMETIVSKMGLPEPENEAQLRELGRISDPEQRAAVYIEAIEVGVADGDREITARDIQVEVDKRLGRGPARSGRKRLTPSERLGQARAIVEELEEVLEQGEDPAKLLRKLLAG
jgi:protein gp37